MPMTSTLQIDSDQEVDLRYDIPSEQYYTRKNADQPIAGLNHNPVAHTATQQIVDQSLIRALGRAHSSQISNEEYEQLLSERQHLLDMKFNGTITQKQARRLQYVRWSLDRIEDSRHGYHLDKLEEITSKYERFSSDLKSMLSQLQRVSHNGRTRR